MRILRFIISALFSVFLVWLLSIQHRVEGSALPPLGAFFSPFNGFWRNAEPSASQHSKEINLPGLKGKVEVKFDRLRVPHIFAENLEDAAMVQGYVTARDRLWQMDLYARKAAGRLSEIMGERTIKVDRMSRRKGLKFAAENDLIGWSKSPQTMQLLEAYSAGVNAWVASLNPSEYPLEFKLLNYAPENWSPVKSAFVLANMAETLCIKEEDLESTNALHLLGRETFDYLFPKNDPRQIPVVPDTGQWKDLKVMLPPPMAASPTSTPARGSGEKLSMQEVLEEIHRESYHVGSNNWALAGAKTAGGKPVLANDPHLSLTLPSIWYQVQIHTPQLNCYGVALPGMPGVVIGFNENIAWGMTNVSQDVADWYQIKWTDGTRTQYTLDGEVRSVQFKYEEIKIKGRPSLMDTVRYTEWGPLTYDYDPDHALHDCAFRWIAHDVPEFSAVEAILGLNTGKNYDDYINALKKFDCPAQNFVFGSNAGTIAIRPQGKYPVRGVDRARFVQDGSTWINGWHHFIPQDHLPTLKDPSWGFVFSANQHSASPTWPYDFYGNFEHYRSRRIFDRLKRMNGATADSMKTMQLDQFSSRAADALPLMLNLLDSTRLASGADEVLSALRSWNCEYRPELLAPTLFEAWYDSCYTFIWDEFIALERQKQEMLLPHTWRTLELMVQDADNVYFDKADTPQKENARDIVTLSFNAMLEGFKKRPEKKIKWGDAKAVTIRHLALIDAFSAKNLHPGGHFSAPNAIQTSYGPSWRMIVELGDRVKAQGVFPGGQSGNPGSRHYDDMVKYWETGQYYELLFLRSPEEQSEQISTTFTFSPG